MQPLEEQWKIAFEDRGDGSKGKPKSFKCSLKLGPKYEIDGTFNEGAMATGTLHGKIDGNKITFEKRYVYQHQVVSCHVYSGQFITDRSMQGDWECPDQKRSGIWSAQPYTPGGLEKFWDLHRCVSLAILIGALAAGYYGIWKPIEEARGFVQTITLNSSLQTMFVVGVPFGLCGLILGEKATRFAENELHEQSAKRAVIFIVLGAIGLGIWIGMEMWLNSMGYKIIRRPF